MTVLCLVLCITSYKYHCEVSSFVCCRDVKIKRLCYLWYYYASLVTTYKNHWKVSSFVCYKIKSWEASVILGVFGIRKDHLVSSFASLSPSLNLGEYHAKVGCLLDTVFVNMEPVARSGVSPSINLACLCRIFGLELVVTPGIMEGKWWSV